MTYFLAWSKDLKTRTMATSGGFTKEVLKYALVSGYVDYLVFPIMEGTKPRVVVTQDYEDLMTPRSNSVYLPISSLQGLTVFTCRSLLLGDCVRFQRVLPVQ